jgi:short-subunit dehydrogenase
LALAQASAMYYFTPLNLCSRTNQPSQNISAKFASKGIQHIILLSRNTQRLQNEDAPFVSKGSPSVKVDTLRIDLSDSSSIPSVLKELDSLTKNEDVEVVFFNAARIQPNEVLGVSVEEIEEDFRVIPLLPSLPIRNN